MNNSTPNEANGRRSSQLDHFGFFVKDTPEDMRKLQPPSSSVVKRDNARIEKWRIMIPKLPELMEKRDKKLKKRIRKGVPEVFRGKVWPILAKTASLKARSSNEYQDLLQQQTPFYDEILKDINRTFPTHQFFADKEGHGQKSLTNVLKALSLEYQDMGYCQGLNFVCALLVIYCNDEEAYWIMNSLMIQYNLKDYYKDLSNVRKPLFVLDTLIKDHYPKVGQLFAKNGIEGLVYATGWFMTLYTNFLPFKLVVRLFDCFFHENYKILYRIGLAIIKIKQKQILQCRDMDEILLCFKNFNEPEFHNDDAFIKIAFGIKLKRKGIEQILSKYVEI